MSRECCQKWGFGKKAIKRGKGVLKPSKHYGLNKKQHSKIENKIYFYKFCFANFKENFAWLKQRKLF